MSEYFNNVSPNYTLNYDNIKEKTGLDCAKWLVDYCIDNQLDLPKYYVHSANPIGRQNIINYLENFRNNYKK
jgi:hypothetical protein